MFGLLAEWGLYASEYQQIKGLGNGLLLFDAKPIPEPILTYCQFDH